MPASVEFITFTRTAPSTPSGSVGSPPSTSFATPSHENCTTVSAVRSSEPPATSAAPRISARAVAPTVYEVSVVSVCAASVHESDATAVMLTAPVAEMLPSTIACADGGVRSRYRSGQVRDAEATRVTSPVVVIDAPAATSIRSALTERLAAPSEIAPVNVTVSYPPPPVIVSDAGGAIRRRLEGAAAHDDVAAPARGDSDRVVASRAGDRHDCAGTERDRLEAGVIEPRAVDDQRSGMRVGRSRDDRVPLAIDNEAVEAAVAAVHPAREHAVRLNHEGVLVVRCAAEPLDVRERELADGACARICDRPHGVGRRTADRVVALAGVKDDRHDVDDGGVEVERVVAVAARKGHPWNVEQRARVDDAVDGEEEEAAVQREREGMSPGSREGDSPRRKRGGRARSQIRARDADDLRLGRRGHRGRGLDSGAQVNRRRQGLDRIRKRAPKPPPRRCPGRQARQPPPEPGRPAPRAPAPRPRAPRPRRRRPGSRSRARRRRTRRPVSELRRGPPLSTRSGTNSAFGTGSRAGGVPEMNCGAAASSPDTAATPRSAGIAASCTGSTTGGTGVAVAAGAAAGAGSTAVRQRSRRCADRVDDELVGRRAVYRCQCRCRPDGVDDELVVSRRLRDRCRHADDIGDDGHARKGIRRNCCARSSRSRRVRSSRGGRRCFRLGDRVAARQQPGSSG